MADFADLTDAEGGKISINPQHVRYFKPFKNGAAEYTAIYLVDEPAAICVQDLYFAVKAKLHSR